MPNRWTIALLLLLGLVIKVPAQEDKVLFSAQGGFYDSCFSLTLNCYYPNHQIRYTTNGTKPTAESTLYQDPLFLDEKLFSTSDIYTIQVTPEGQMFHAERIEKCIVIRAAVFNESGQQISTTVTNTYFIHTLGNDSHGLPLVSVCADSLALFDNETGIFVPGIHFDPDNPEWTGNYYQRGREWEREINFEFYELDNTGINQRAGIRTHGGNGRRFQQKNLAVYARDDYGKKRFKHQFFTTIPNNSFKHLQLKPFNSAWTPAGLQDPLCQAIASQLPHVESLATRPVVLFINGEYWGIYYIHEKPDERYLEDHFNIDLDACDIMGNWQSLCEYGNGDDFMETMRWLENADLGNPMDFARVERFFDLESFIDYQILELVLANTDWPTNNMRCWRADNGKWRWIFYDGDACLRLRSFDVFANATAFNRSTLLFRRLLANEAFRNNFFDRFRELTDSHFQYTETHALLIKLQDEIRDEIPSQAERFGTPVDMRAWEKQCRQLDEFLQQRPTQVIKKLNEFIHAESWSLSDWRCYPNPSSESVTLSFHADQSRHDVISIYDITGKLVYASSVEIPAGPNVITLHPDFATGVYLLTIGNKRQYLIRY